MKLEARLLLHLLQSWLAGYRKEIEWNGNRNFWDTAPHHGVSTPILSLFQ
jgi:hypothetical protein